MDIRIMLMGIVEHLNCLVPLFYKPLVAYTTRTLGDLRLASFRVQLCTAVRILLETRIQMTRLDSEGVWCARACSPDADET